MFEDLRKDNNQKLDQFKAKEENKEIFPTNYNDKINSFQESVNVNNKELKPRKNKTKLSLGKILIIFFIVLILGGGTWFYYVQGEAMLLSRNMKWEWGNKTENYYTESSLFLKIKNIDFKTQSTNAFLMSESIPESLQLNFNSNFKIIKENGEGFLILELDLGPKLNLDLDFKKIDQDLYLKPKITGLSEVIPFITVSDIDSKDEWIWIELDGQNVPLDIFNTPESDSVFKDLEEKVPVFLDTLREKNIFGIKDSHQVKKLNDSKLKKIEYFVKEDKIDDFVFSSIDVFSKDEDKAYETKKEFIESKTKKPEEWENIKNFIKNLKIYLWIDTQNKIIKGIDFNLNNFEIDTKNFALSLDLEFSNFIGDIEKTEILTPNNYISMEEFAQKMEEEMYPEQFKKQDDMMQDTDGDGLLDYVEQAIGTDISNQDTDGDGYLDGEEIEAGYDPLGPDKLDESEWEFYLNVIESYQDY